MPGAQKKPNRVCAYMELEWGEWNCRHVYTLETCRVEKGVHKLPTGAIYSVNSSFPSTPSNLSHAS